MQWDGLWCNYGTAPGEQSFHLSSETGTIWIDGNGQDNKHLTISSGSISFRDGNDSKSISKAWIDSVDATLSAHWDRINLLGNAIADHEARISALENA